MFNYYTDHDVSVMVQFVQGMPFIHCQARVMRYKKFEKIWEQVCSRLKNEGHYTVFSCIVDGDEKVYKFQTLFGMEEKYRSNGQILFAKEL